jgi:hypothetical protein
MLSILIRRKDLQHPAQGTMEISINSFEINQRHVFPQNHFIKTRHKVGIEESAVEDSQTKTSPYEFEIAEMVGVNARGVVDL